MWTEINIWFLFLFRNFFWEQKHFHWEVIIESNYIWGKIKKKNTPNNNPPKFWSNTFQDEGENRNAKGNLGH